MEKNVSTKRWYLLTARAQDEDSMFHGNVGRPYLPIFRVEEGEIIFLLNVGIYLSSRPKN
jgi:hypothetical protein